MQGVVWRVGKWVSGVGVRVGLCARLCESHVHVRRWVCVRVANDTCTRDGEGHLFPPISRHLAESAYRNFAERLGHREYAIKRGAFNTVQRGPFNTAGAAYVMHLRRIECLVFQSVFQKDRDVLLSLLDAKGELRRVRPYVLPTSSAKQCGPRATVVCGTA